jgi:hypothetical protein
MTTEAQIRKVRGPRCANPLNSTLALALALLAFAIPTPADNAGAAHRQPDLPSPLCDRVAVPAGNVVQARLSALGVQIYRWNGTSWSFIAPAAGLYADAGYHGELGIHYAGPTWEANDGSKVTATVVERCAPFPGAIPWLLLQATPVQSHGVFSRVTYIQRLNTIGGTAPAEPGAFLGQEARVPYTAEYVFYRANKN